MQRQLAQIPLRIQISQGSTTEILGALPKTYREQKYMTLFIDKWKEICFLIA